MSDVVVDASAIVELLVGTHAGLQVSAVLDGRSAAAPAHFDAEVLATLGRLARRGTIPEVDVEPAIEALRGAPIERYGLPPLLLEAWNLRRNVANSDALYVALARILGASLVTTDARLSRAPGIGVPVIVVGV